MRISGKKLLSIDRLFWLPHRLAEFLLSDVQVKKENRSNRILVIKFMGLGSIVRLASLCEKYHVDKTRILFLTLSSNDELCKRVGFRNTLLIRTKNIFLFLQDCRKTFLAVKTEKPELIIDYERCSHAVGLFRTVLAWLGKSKSVSFEFKRNFDSSRQTVYPADQISQLEIFMVGIELMPTIFNESFEKIVGVQSFKILININASNYLLARRYPLDHFVSVVKALNAWDSRLEFYLTGTSVEYDHVNLLVKKVPDLPVHNVCGKWTMEKLWSELSECALFITGDSGPLHMAAYIGVTTVAVWGPTQPEHFGYVDDDHAHLHHLSLKLSCSPCFKHPASHPARVCHGKINCLNELQPSLISKKAIHILSSHISERKIHIPITVASNLSSQFQPTLV